ncbi:GNAT family N-acetyltransferase [Vagococcus silagei]|uniref:GNAT family N-acetyltransferase n=1 Tax=Vagococcus silagei TaxID=2508885 RepID=A0A4S3B5X6_9ENTE|nr:GNAT family N-acetyltransferase [Vagococcus silagei]THB61737.1 GNAT family N-acetyltransferase [Vagococcus silagei]
MNYCVIKDQKPTLKEYQELCESVGWEEAINFEAAAISIEHSLFSVLIMNDEKLIGMGRIIGDGAVYFYIQDVVVHPDYQGQGIGKLIMNDLLNYLEQNAPQKAFVGLFASEGNEKFYQAFDFNNYAPQMTGMFRVIR